MASKDELQTILKEQYGINKNISQSLEQEDCEQLLVLLQQESSAIKLVESFVQKNASLRGNNSYYGRLRNQAERKLETLAGEHAELEASIESLETAKVALESRKQQLEEEQQKLQAEIQSLSSKNNMLSHQVGTLTTQNDELLGANEQLKKDNKDLKNIVDAIRLRLARDTKVLLELEDSKIRKALIRLFAWTLG